MKPNGSSRTDFKWENKHREITAFHLEPRPNAFLIPFCVEWWIVCIFDWMAEAPAEWTSAPIELFHQAITEFIYDKPMRAFIIPLQLESLNKDHYYISTHRVGLFGWSWTINHEVRCKWPGWKKYVMQLNERISPGNAHTLSCSFFLIFCVYVSVWHFVLTTYVGQSPRRMAICFGCISISFQNISIFFFFFLFLGTPATMSVNPNGDPNDLSRNKSADEMNPNDSTSQINTKVNS